MHDDGTITLVPKQVNRSQSHPVPARPSRTGTRRPIMSLVTPLPDIAPASRSQTMRALVLDTHGGAFRDTLAARPEPGSGAVLVPIAARGVNPLDPKTRSPEERREGKEGVSTCN